MCWEYVFLVFFSFYFPGGCREINLKQFLLRYYITLFINRFAYKEWLILFWNTCHSRIQILFILHRWTMVISKKWIPIKYKFKFTKDSFLYSLIEWVEYLVLRQYFFFTCSKTILPQMAKPNYSVVLNTSRLDYIITLVLNFNSFFLHKTFLQFSTFYTNSQEYTCTGFKPIHLYRSPNMPGSPVWYLPQLTSLEWDSGVGA